MCFSEKQSKIAFFTNIITCVILYFYPTKDPTKSKTNKILALFFGFVGFMQVFDWIFWKNQDMSDPKQEKTNYLFTRIAMIFNHLQPIVLGLLVYIYLGKLGKISKKLLGLYIPLITIYSMQVFQSDKMEHTITKEIESKRKTLDWKWNSMKYSLLVYAVFLACLTVTGYENLQYPTNIIFSFISVFSFVFSLYAFKSQTTGRFWCKTSAFIPLIFLLQNILKN